MAVYTLNSRGGGSNQGTLTQTLLNTASQQALARIVRPVFLGSQIPKVDATLFADSGSFAITGNDAQTNVGMPLNMPTLDPSTMAWDSFNVGVDPNLLLSNGNLTVQGNSGFGRPNGTIRSTRPWVSGSKNYIEVKCESLDNYMVVGVGTTNTDGNVPGGGTSNSAGYLSTVGSPTFNTGDIVGLAVDCTGSSPLVWWHKNGTWIGGDPVAGTGGTGLSGGPSSSIPVYAYLWVNDGGDKFTVNFGASAFAYTPPTGFTASALSYGQFQITGYSATLTAHVGSPNLAANSGTFNITGYAAGLAVGLPAGSGSFAITGYSATLDAKLPASSGSFAITGYSAGMAIGVPAGSGSFAYTGYAAGLAVKLPANSGTFTYTGYAATLIHIGKLPAGSGTFAITGNAAGLGANLPGVSGSCNITGYAASMGVGLALGSGSFAYTGYAAGLKVNLPASSGSFSITGNAATLIHIAKLAAGSGSFAITGNAAGFGANLPALSGSFAITGYSTGMAAKEPAASGSFTYTGYAAGFAVGWNVGSGSFLINGNSATMALGLKLAAGSGSFAYSGYSVAAAVGEPDASGSFAITGYAAKFGVQMPLGSGAFTYTGYSATFAVGHGFVAGSGSFAIAGQAANLQRAADLFADSGSFLITGASASFGAAITVGAGVFTITGNAAELLRMGVHRSLAAGSGSFIIAGGDTIWRRFRPKYATWVQPPVAPPVQVPYESLIRRTDPAFRKGGQRLPEYEFTTHTFEADPTQRGAYEAP